MFAKFSRERTVHEQFTNTVSVHEHASLVRLYSQTSRNEHKRTVREQGLFTNTNYNV